MRILIVMFVVAALCAPAIAGEGMLVFKTDPKDVEVYIDGVFKVK